MCTEQQIHAAAMKNVSLALLFTIKTVYHVFFGYHMKSSAIILTSEHFSFGTHNKFHKNKLMHSCWGSLRF